MLPEDRDLEVVAAESPDAAPPGERLGVEQERSAQRGFRMHFVPPAVRVGRGDRKGREHQGHERGRGRRGGDPEQALTPAPRQRRRCTAREEGDIGAQPGGGGRSEEHTSELPSLAYLVCRLLLGKKEHTLELQSLAYLVCRLLLEKKKWRF